MIGLEDTLKVFRNGPLGKPTVAPAGYKINLLKYTMLKAGMFSSGCFQKELLHNDTRFIMTIGLAPRLIGGTSMLRFLAVEAQNLDDKCDKLGITLEGDPSSDSGDWIGIRPITFIARCGDEEYVKVTEAQRLLGGIFNTLQHTGIYEHCKPVDLLRITSLFGSENSDRIMESLISDPFDVEGALLHLGNSRNDILDVRTPDYGADIDVEYHTIEEVPKPGTSTNLQEKPGLFAVGKTPTAEGDHCGDTSRDTLTVSPSSPFRMASMRSDKDPALIDPESRSIRHMISVCAFIDAYSSVDLSTSLGRYKLHERYVRQLPHTFDESVSHENIVSRALGIDLLMIPIGSGGKGAYLIPPVFPEDEEDPGPLTHALRALATSWSLRPTVHQSKVYGLG